MVSLAGVVYQVAVWLTIASSIGDKHGVMDLNWWYSIQTLLPVLLVADENTFGIHNSGIRYGNLMKIKYAATGAATLQSMAFFVWACAEWADRGDRAEPFLPISAALLGFLTLLGSLMLIFMVRMQFVRRMDA